MPYWCRRGESLQRIGWRDALDAIQAGEWKLCGGHLVLDGFTYYYLTGASLERLKIELEKQQAEQA